MNGSFATRTSLSSLLGTAIADGDGRSQGRIKEFLVDPLISTHHIAHFLLKSSTAGKGLLVPVTSLVMASDGSIHIRAGSTPEMAVASEGMVYLDKDLLDQQIIDVHGHKVVRVNDVDLVWEHPSSPEAPLVLRIAEVEVGPRGAVRRLLKGLPHKVVDIASRRFQPRVIPWEFVDLIDRDPARRVRLKVEQDRLSTMHPSDIAEILEELGPTERDAVFTSLDAEIAAEALEEVEPRLQKALLEGMDSERAAEIVEEMDPGAAADLLAELSDERSEAILEEMEPEERQEVEDLLEFPGDWAAGRMTTDYVQVSKGGDVTAAIAALREFEGDIETINDIYLVDVEDKLKGSVILARMLLAEGRTKLSEIAEAKTVSCAVDASGRYIAELFDKYNLRSLPVVDSDGRVAGVIHAEHVISLLRSEK